jgi:hypothetical protein
MKFIISSGIYRDVHKLYYESTILTQNLKYYILPSIRTNASNIYKKKYAFQCKIISLQKITIILQTLLAICPQKYELHNILKVLQILVYRPQLSAPIYNSINKHLVTTVTDGVSLNSVTNAK